MITRPPTQEQLTRWKKLSEDFRSRAAAPRLSGKELADYLTALYPALPVEDSEVPACVSEGAVSNCVNALRLAGRSPRPVAFRIENRANGAVLYGRRTGVFARCRDILAGIDLESGYFYVEGSEQLWDELCARQGVDAFDRDNYVCIGSYLECLEHRPGLLGLEVTVTVDRPLGSSHPRHPEMVYPVNYGYVEGIMAPDGAWQDAYILGIDHPAESFTGVIAAVILREDDIEEKWVVVPQGTTLTPDEIMAQVSFQERYFRSRLII